MTPASGPSRHAMSRRSFLGLAGAGLAVASCGVFDARDPISTVGRVDFRDPLRIPPLAESVVRDGARVFELVTQAGRTRIVDAGVADTWGVNGALLGPTLRARRGERVLVHVRNDLPETTTLHWHGMHLPAAADGGPHQAVEPGATWSPSWTIDQPAATLWYHPHPHGQTERHVYRGLGGLFIVDDDEESALALPRDYGVDDIPVIVQDKTFDDSGRLVETDRVDNGMLGDTILVNGTAAPVFEASATRTRLRLLNASTARSYAFGIDDDRPLELIATDGGLLPAPVPTRRVLLTPGERAEVILHLEPGESVVLRSYPQELGLSASRARTTGATDELDVMLVRAVADPRRSPAPPRVLAAAPDLHTHRVAATRSFELRSDRINGESMDMGRIDEVVTVDTTEIWEVRNAHGQPHNFHVHDVRFQVLSIGGEPPPPELSGWKDTIYLPPDVDIRLALRFTDHTDPAVPYMYHCHLLWHEDKGMMGQFVVVDEGQSATAGGHGHG
ncbi:multicopper oxidase family protein [Actinophytocola gossypii]|uniref:Multicopper oxidase CueO n=1 Tax=Actinophytocola gossypii TaxID=2812003 RepID=A0ABT2JAS2_9PSEU|nr:multicopper oxidase domain-containing protein [Actinophytocola gossypii]MCT2584945.1 multicopper oxidase domain-containing protein [Actinophytocola gossypii]